MTLTPDMAKEVRARAKRERVSLAFIAARAMRAWLEDEEDKYLSAIGDAIAENPGRLYTHEEVWSKIKVKQ